nr:MAG TPA_asm: hypothetical protein [Caudoviricetes sp.]
MARKYLLLSHSTSSVLSNNSTHKSLCTLSQ